MPPADLELELSKQQRPCWTTVERPLLPERVQEYFSTAHWQETGFFGQAVAAF